MWLARNIWLKRKPPERQLWWFLFSLCKLKLRRAVTAYLFLSSLLQMQQLITPATTEIRNVVSISIGFSPPSHWKESAAPPLQHGIKSLSPFLLFFCRVGKGLPRHSRLKKHPFGSGGGTQHYNSFQSKIYSVRCVTFQASPAYVKRYFDEVSNTSTPLKIRQKVGHYLVIKTVKNGE